MSKIKVLLADGLRRVVFLDPDATKGAVLGSDVSFADGSVPSAAQWQALLNGAGASSSSGASTSRYPLTRTNDTNVTLTLSGSPTLALNAAVGVAVGWTGQLAATRGGTGYGAYTAGDLLYASSTTALAKLAIGSASDLLTVSGGAPAWIARTALLASPSATYGVDMAGANGSATTGLRSDAVLKIDPAIAPQWTGIHQWRGTSPTVQLYETDGGADEKLWEMQAEFQHFALRSRTDAGGTGHNFIYAGRSGIVPSTLEFGESAAPFTSLSFWSAGTQFSDGSVSICTFSSAGFFIPVGYVQFSDQAASAGVEFYPDPAGTVINSFGGEDLIFWNGYNEVLRITAAGVRVATTTLIGSTVALADGAGAAAGTLLNAPVAGNPTKWLAIDDNGTTRHVPAW